MMMLKIFSDFSSIKSSKKLSISYENFENNLYDVGLIRIDVHDSNNTKNIQNETQDLHK